MVQRLFTLPALPDGAHGVDVVAHARSGWAPGNPVAALVVGLHLSAQPQIEASGGRLVQVPGYVGCNSGRPRKSHRHRSAQLDALGHQSGRRQRKVRAVRVLQRHHPVEPRPLRLPRHLLRLLQIIVGQLSDHAHVNYPPLFPAMARPAHLSLSQT